LIDIRPSTRVRVDGDISNWNPKAVTSMRLMFSVATSFNGDIFVEAVTNMRIHATSFNGDMPR